MFINAAATLTLAHLGTQFFALLAGIQVFRQALSLGRRKAHLPLVAFGCSWRIALLLVLPISRVPVVEEHLVKKRLLLMLRQQTALERVIKIFLIGDINVVQRLGEIE